MDQPSVLPIRLQPSNLRPIAYRILSKKHGLNIQTEALAKLTEVVGHKFGTEWKGPRSQQFLEEIAKIWKVQDRGLFIDGEGVTQVIKELFNKDRIISNKTNKSAQLDTILAARSDTLSDSIIDVDDELLRAKKVNVYDDLKWSDFFRVINAFDQPKYKYNHSRKQFDLLPSSNNKILNANSLRSNIEYFSNRYYLLRDRLSRNENFEKSTFTSLSSITGAIKSSAHEITLIKNLLGRDGQRFLLFGILAKDPSGFWALQDQSDTIKLDLNQALSTEGSYYTPGMFLLCDGIYSNSGKFYASNVGHPPAERREATLENYGNLDLLGINNPINSKNQISRVDRPLRKKLQNLEKELTQHKIIIMGSDCFLDELKVFDGLKKFFRIIEDSLEFDPETIPLAIIIPGSFISKPLHPTNTSSTTISNSALYKNSFDILANLLEKYPNVCQKVKFIFVPGNNDAWQSSYSIGSAGTWPQNRIPKIFCNRLERVIKDSVWATNPTRLSYLSQDMVICRDDLSQKLKRNDVIFPAEVQEEEARYRANLEKSNENDLNIDNLLNEQEKVSPEVTDSRKMVKTILDQGTLQPFPINLKPVNFSFEHVLRIEPLPTVVILNDPSISKFDVTYKGCKVINAGRLIQGRRLNYAEYTPSTKRCEFKEIYF